ncbi:MAG: winged helix-turn-helix transcriptional regulator [Nannocystaceae bacterium]
MRSPARESPADFHTLSKIKSLDIRKYSGENAPVSERRYHQFCGVAKALDLVGERWTLLLARDLLLGGRRFSDLLQAMPGLTPNLLSQRLRQLQEAGLVAQERLPPPGGATLYVLTPLGRELEPVILALGRFGARWLVAPGDDDRVDPRWAVVSLKRRYVRPAADARRWRVALHLGELGFALELGGERLEARDGAPTEADLVLRMELPALGALLFGGASARALVAEGRIAREGPARALADFARAFGFQP